MFDLDACVYCEFDAATREPLALIETAMDRGKALKLVPSRAGWRSKLSGAHVYLAECSCALTMPPCPFNREALTSPSFLTTFRGTARNLMPIAKSNTN